MCTNKSYNYILYSVWLLTLEMIQQNRNQYIFKEMKS